MAGIAGDGRARLAGLLGHKLIIGTTTLHYLCGRLTSFETDVAVFAVGAQRVRLPLAHIDTVSEASEAQAEFVK
jgi:hypothetical protein